MVITLQTLFIPLVAQAEEDEKQEKIPVEVLLALCSSYSGAVTILLHDTALPQPDGRESTVKTEQPTTAGTEFPSAAPDVSKRLLPSLPGGVCNFQSRNIRQPSNG